MWLSESPLLFFTLLNTFLSPSECYFTADWVKSNRKVPKFYSTAVKKRPNIVAIGRTSIQMGFSESPPPPVVFTLFVRLSPPCKWHFNVD